MADEDDLPLINVLSVKNDNEHVDAKHDLQVPDEGTKMDLVSVMAPGVPAVHAADGTPCPEVEGSAHVTDGSSHAEGSTRLEIARPEYASAGDGTDPQTGEASLLHGDNVEAALQPEAPLADGATDPSVATAPESQKDDNGSGLVRRTSSRTRHAPAPVKAVEAPKRKAVAPKDQHPESEGEPSRKKARKGMPKPEGDEEEPIGSLSKPEVPFVGMRPYIPCHPGS